MALTDYSGHVGPKAKKKRKKPLPVGPDRRIAPGGIDTALPAPQAPRFPAPEPQKTPVSQFPIEPRQIESATYGMNLKNLSQAYFAKYATFPNAMQTYFMLLNAQGALWSADEWGKMLAPGKAAPSPLFNEFERVISGGKSPLKNITMGVGTEAPPVKEEVPQLYRDRRSTTPLTSSEAAFSVNEEDPRMIGRKVAPPDFANIPLNLAELDNRIAVEVGGMDPAQIAAYSKVSGNMVEWKRYWASVKEAKGEKVGFNPNSPQWSKSLDREYHRYLWYRVLPYLQAKDAKTKAAAQQALEVIQPELLGETSLDPQGVYELKFASALVNVSEILHALPDDESRKVYFFNSFAAGRKPGDSDRKVLYDYVSEFGQDHLPTDKVSEYRESLWTLNKVASWPFEKLTGGVKGALEFSDFAFDALKQQPGMWGTVGEMMHTAYNKGIIEANPFTSSLIPMAISYGHQAGGAVLDLWHDEMMMNSSLPGFMEEDSYQARAKERALKDPDVEVSTWYGIVAANEWVQRFDNHAGKDMFVDLGDDYLNDQGVPQDSWARQGFRDTLTAGSFYVTLKVAGKSDMYVRRIAISQARKGFSALRFGEDVLRRRKWDAAEGPYRERDINKPVPVGEPVPRQQYMYTLGPAKKNDAGVKVRDVTLRDGVIVTVDASIAEDIGRLNDEGFKTHQSHGEKADHPKGHDAADLPPYVEFKTPGMTPKQALRIQEAADRAGMEVTKGKAQQGDKFVHTVIIKGENIHEFVNELLGRPENLMTAPDRMFPAEEFIGEGQQAGLEMGIDTTAVKGRYEAPPQRPVEMPGQTGLDVGGTRKPVKTMDDSLPEAERQKKWEQDNGWDIPDDMEVNWWGWDENGGMSVRVTGKNRVAAAFTIRPGENFEAAYKEARRSEAEVSARAVESAKAHPQPAYDPSSPDAVALRAHEAGRSSKPHEGRLTQEQDPVIRELEAEADSIRAGLEREASAQMERQIDSEMRGDSWDVDRPAADDAELISHIKQVASDHGGLARDPTFWDPNLSIPQNNQNFLGLARARPNKRVAKGVRQLTLDEIADGLGIPGIDGDYLWGVMQREVQRRAGKTPKAKTGTPKETRDAMARLDAIEAEIARRKAQRGAPQRTPTPEEARMPRGEEAESWYTDVASDMRGSGKPVDVEGTTFHPADVKTPAPFMLGEEQSQRRISYAYDEAMRRTMGENDLLPQPGASRAMVDEAWSTFLRSDRRANARLWENLADVLEERGIWKPTGEAAPQSRATAGRPPEATAATSPSPSRPAASEPLARTGVGPSNQYQGTLATPENPVPRIVRGAEPRPLDDFDRMYRYKQDNPVVKGLPDAEEWIRQNPHSLTASYREDILMDPAKVGKLPGELGEEARMALPKERARIDALALKMAKDGWQGEAIPVHIYADGKAVIMEGNHRVRAAEKAGLRDIPVEVRYYGGGETRTSFNPRDYLRDESRFAGTPVPSEPPTRTGVAPSNQYQGTLATPESPVPRRAEGTYPDKSLEIADLKRRLDEAGTYPETGAPERTGLAPSNQYQVPLGEAQAPFGIPRTPEDGGPLGQQPLDTVGAGEVPPTAKPPVEYSNGLPPDHPQYWHVKALMTVAEYIAKYGNENSASLIRRMLNLEDEAALPEHLRAGVTEAVRKMQATHDPEVVLSILDDLEAKGIDTIDALGPSFFRSGRARTYENAFAAAEKMGPLGVPLLKAIRLMGTPIHLNRQIPFRDADNHVRNLGISFNMGRKKMTAADLEELRSFEQQMFEAQTKLERDNVLHRFENRIVENMQAEGTWEAYKDFEAAILGRRAAILGKHLGVVKKEVYGQESSVPPPVRQVHAEIEAARKRSADYESEGNAAQAQFWKDVADEGQARLDEAQASAHIYADAVKNPQKYRMKNEKGENVAGNGPGGYAMNESYNSAIEFLRNYGEEQPVWMHQLKQKLTMDQVDPRMLAWFQSGKGWRKFMKYDTAVMEPFIRQWKMWTLAGLGFPVRVFAGDEFWRLPMEGINPLAGAGRAVVKNLRGDLSKSEQKRLDALVEKDKAKTISKAEKAELDTLKEMARPKAPEDVLNLLGKDEMRANADVLNVGRDYWQLLGPTRNVDNNGRVTWSLPDDPRYLPRVARDIGLFAKEPVVQMLMQERGWTKETASQAIRVLLISDTEAGRATRDFLAQTGRISSEQMNIHEMQRALAVPTGGAYRNLDNIIGEWVDMYLRMDNSPEMRQGLRDGYIAISDLERVDPAAMPTVPIGAFDKGVSHPIASWLNIGPKLYDRVTLPMMTMIGGKIRDTLFGAEYLRQRDMLLKKMPDIDPEVLMDQAAGRAAHFVERTTYTRDATIFEDMVRNHLLFINSYRQFWVYWLSKMVTRPVTMGTLWTMAPQEDDPGLMGAIARHFSQYMPFFLQPRVSGEDRELTPGAMAKAIATPPGLGPPWATFTGWAIRGMLGTDPALLPGQAAMGSSLLPGNRFGLITEALLNVNLEGISKDDVTSHALLTKWMQETVDPSEYAEGVGDKPIRSNLPDTLAAMVWLRDLANKGAEKLGQDWLKNRVFGNPIAFEQLVSSLTGAPSSLAVQRPPFYMEYTAERVKWSELMLAGKDVEAAKYMATTKRAQYVDAYNSAAKAADRTKMLEEMPWLYSLSNSAYVYDPQGSLIFDDSWVREAKSEAVAMNDLREDIRNQVGGAALDPVTGIPMRTAAYVYPGDIARREEMPKIRQHKKEITEVAKAAARELATVNGVVNKKWYEDLMADWKARTGTYVMLNKWDTGIDSPVWYDNYLKKHKEKLGKDMPPGYSLAAYWHPKLYAEKVVDLWKSGYQGGAWKPTPKQAETIARMIEMGLVDKETTDTWVADGTITSRVVDKASKEALDKWRNNVVYISSDTWTQLDSKRLNRIGFNFGPEIDEAIYKVRLAYFKWTSIVGTKAADGDIITPSSREYRDGRKAFNIYKDSVFSKVKGGEAFVGGTPERLMHIPFLTGNGLPFTGEDAVDDTKLWKSYLAAATGKKQNLKLMKDIHEHFDDHLDDKLDAYRAANDWVMVTSTALYMRRIMKASYSEYYQGPGNSAYSNYGQAMVKKLDRFIGSLARNNKTLTQDIKRYGWEDEHDLAFNLLEWYEH